MLVLAGSEGIRIKGLQKGLTMPTPTFPLKRAKTIYAARWWLEIDKVGCLAWLVWLVIDMPLFSAVSCARLFVFGRKHYPSRVPQKRRAVTSGAACELL